MTAALSHGSDLPPERAAERRLRREVSTETVYAPDCPGMMLPRRTPFDTSVGGGAFLYVREGKWTYLLERTPSSDEVYHGAHPASFSRYAGMWILERIAAFPGGEPRLWPDLPLSDALDLPRLGPREGASIVFKDPLVQFTQTHENIVATTLDQTQARVIAEAFAAEYGVATCVARLVTIFSWH